MTVQTAGLAVKGRLYKSMMDPLMAGRDRCIEMGG